MKLQRCTAAMLSMALLVSLSACKSPTGEASPSPEPDAQEVTFTRENFPRLDGSADAVPLARNLAAVLLGEFQQQTSDLTQFSGTDQAFQRLMEGECDLLLVSDPQPSVLDDMKQSGFEVQMEQLVQDGLVFVVPADNPVDSLTVEQLRGIYTGEITNWKDVGGQDGEILPFQHGDDTGSQALMEQLVLDGQKMIDAPKGYAMTTYLEAGAQSYTYSPNSIGYTFYRHTQDLSQAQGMKLLQVDGVSPSAQAIENGSYPLSTAYYVAMAAQQPQDSLTSALYHWLLGQSGQQLLEGYPTTFQPEASAPDVTITAHWDMLEPLHTPKVERWYEEYTDHLIPSDEYGQLVPYIGGNVSSPSTTDWVYGLATQDGVIVTDPVYSEAEYISASGDPLDSTTSFHLLLTTYEMDGDGIPEPRLGVAAGDGSWYTGQVYRKHLRTCALGSLMVTPDEDLVMVSPDGTATPFHLSQDVALPTLPTGLAWPYLYWPTDDTMTNFVYIDLRDGTVSTQPPADFQAPSYVEGKGYFPDGWFQLEGTTLAIHTDADAVHTLDVGEGCTRAEVNGDRVLLVYDTDPVSFRVTDWEGNDIFDGTGYAPSFLFPTYSDTPALLSYYTTFFDDPTQSYVVMSRDGKSPFAAQGFVHQYGNRLIYATQSHYILSNLAGDPLLCLPRLDA